LPHIVRSTGAKTLVTLVNEGTPFKRPKEIARERHLFIAISDIIEPCEGHIVPALSHIDDFLGFVVNWDQQHPLVIHCFAGVSRSTAAAYIAACALNPNQAEAEIAQAIRQKSPTATPNARLIALADQKLRREGRMIKAIEAIGRGQDCYEGVPFALNLI
jgi:predicted protein tyrosine phosphatase